MSAAVLPVEMVRQIIADVMRPCHFSAKPPLMLEWQTVAETVAWEAYRGQLVPPHLTREKCTFESWNVFGHDEMGRSGEPLLSLKLDLERGQIHVVRGLLCHVWEGYDAGGNVYQSREVQRWVRELVGSRSVMEF